MPREHRASARRHDCRRRSSSPTTTRATPPAPSSLARSTRPPSSRSTASASGRTATLGIGRGNRIELTQQLHFPHSLGLLYSAFTYYCGFKVNSGEYKLMGLAPYGQPVYAEPIHKHLIDLKPDGSFRLNMGYFNYCQGLTMTSRRFHRLFGGPPRKPESTLEQRHMDLAASIQAVTEEIDPAHRPARPRANRDEEPGPGRRRGAQLRRQRPAPARRPVRRRLDSAGRRRRRRRVRRRAVHLAPAARTSRGSAGGRDTQQRQLARAARSTTTRSSGS